MRGIDGDIVLDEGTKAPISMADDRLGAAPEHSVVNEYQLRSRVDRALDDGARKIDSGCDALDLSLVGHLDAVQGSWIVGNARNIQQLVDEAGDLGESCHFLEAVVSTWTLYCPASIND